MKENIHKLGSIKIKIFRSSDGTMMREKKTNHLLG